MGPLLSRKQKVELACSLVSPKVPFGLEIRMGVIRALLSTTDNSPEAFGAQESFHLPLPGRVVGGGEFLKGRSRRTGGVVGHEDRKG